MSQQDLLDRLPNTDNGYTPVQIPGVPQGLQDSVYSGSNYANRPGSNFTQDANKDVAEKSNLMGPSNPNDPESSALSSRANQIYHSNVSRVMAQGEPQGAERQVQLQGQDIMNRSALYQNAQSRATLNYQQLSYQREAAIMQEQIKRQLLESIFKGVGALGGFFGMKGLVNAKRPSSFETKGTSAPDTPSQTSMPTMAESNDSGMFS